MSTWSSTTDHGSATAPSSSSSSTPRAGDEGDASPRRSESADDRGERRTRPGTGAVSTNGHASGAAPAPAVAATTAPAAGPAAEAAGAPEAAPPATIGARLASFWIERVLMGSARRWPRAIARLRGVGAHGTYLASPTLRHATTVNARRVLGPGASRRAVRSLAIGTLARHFDFIAEMDRWGRNSLDALVQRIAVAHGDELFSAAVARGKGVIIATAHLGSFEVGAAAVRARTDDVHVVFKRDPWPAFESARRRLREVLDIHEAPIDDGIDTWIRLRDVLERGGILLMQADRALPGQGVQRVPFLGGTAELPTGAFRLASMTGAAVLPVFAPRRADGQVDIHIEPPLYAASRSEVAASVGRLATIIETYVQRYPDQWLMMHPVCVEDRRDVSTGSPSGPRPGPGPGASPGSDPTRRSA